MPFKINIEYNPTEFRVFKPQLVGIFRSDTTPVSNNATDLYLRYVSKPLGRPLELEKGFADQAKKNAINNKYESLLEWISLNKQLFQLNPRPDHSGANCLDAVDFVASTGTLSFLLKIPYELDNNFSILAEMLNGTIYLKIKRIGMAPNNSVARDSSTFIRRPSFVAQAKATSQPFAATTTNDYDLTSYCELKLRQHFTEKINNNENADFRESKLNEWVSFGGKKAGDKHKSKKKSHNVSEKITFVFRTKVKKHNIVFSDEVDSFEQINPANRDNFGIVKFKLVKKGLADRNEYLNAMRKMRWWSTCVFSSVRRLVVGFWSHEHVVDEVREFTNLTDLRCPIYWSADVCFNNLNSILTLIKHGFSQLNTSTICVNHVPNTRELVCYPSNLKVLPSFFKDQLNAQFV